MDSVTFGGLFQPISLTPTRLMVTTISKSWRWSVVPLACQMTAQERAAFRRLSAAAAGCSNTFRGSARPEPFYTSTLLQYLKSIKHFWSFCRAQRSLLCTGGNRASTAVCPGDLNSFILTCCHKLCSINSLDLSRKPQRDSFHIYSEISPVRSKSFGQFNKINIY